MFKLEFTTDFNEKDIEKAVNKMAKDAISKHKFPVDVRYRKKGERDWTVRHTMEEQTIRLGDGENVWEYQMRVEGDKGAKGEWSKTQETNDNSLLIRVIKKFNF